MTKAPDDTLAPSGAPPSALRIWADKRGNVFIEIPGRKGPYIETMNYDHRAVAHIFSLLGVHSIEQDVALQPLPDSYKPDHGKGSTWDVDRAMADRILKQMGLIK